MIVTRTPLRVSFFGGGTDYPEYFNRKRGSVIGMAINKYVYVTAMPLSPLHPYRYRLYWSKIERCMEIGEIEHPVVREALKLHNATDPMGFSIIADLPARNGLGSSSAFTVGFLRALEPRYSQADLAANAVHIERGLLKESGGWQDQYHSAFGGLNRIDFDVFGVSWTPIRIRGDCLKALTSSLFLIYTGDTRNSWEVNTEQVKATSDGKIDDELDAMVWFVDQAQRILETPDPAMVYEFGDLLHEGWQLKKRLSSRITCDKIDSLYEAARASGAIGGKLCGAGAGGFLMVLVPPDRQAHFLKRMIGVPVIPVGIDTQGSIVVLNESAR